MRSLIVLSIFTVLFTHCNNNPLTDRTSEKEIQGYVTEEFSGLAIDSVKVHLQATDYAAFTDSTGFYSFKDMSYDKYRIIVDKDEYKTSDSLVEYYSGGIKTVNLKISKNILIATTDSISYILGNIHYTIFNNSIYSAYFNNCCGIILYAIVTKEHGDWVFSRWYNETCNTFCINYPIELLPDSTYFSYPTIKIAKSGIYKIATLFGFHPNYARNDTVFTNTFTVMKE